MKAKFTRKLRHNGQHHHDKETVNDWKVCVIHKGAITVPVRACCWMGRSKSASVVYGSIWVNGKKFDVSGSGSAGGCGYHKESAAIQEAIRGAAIKLYDDETGKEVFIDGVGDTAIHHALYAIARAAGYRGKATIV